MSPFTEISIIFQEGIIKKISYNRRSYEPVEEKSRYTKRVNITIIFSHKISLKKSYCQLGELNMHRWCQSTALLTTKPSASSKRRFQVELIIVISPIRSCYSSPHD